MGVEWLLLYLLLGSCVGFLSGLLGVGGGGMLVPILTLIFLYQGVDAEAVVHMALATSMACMIFSTFSSFRAHHGKGAVLWPAVQAIVPGVIIGSFLSTFLVSHLNTVYLSIMFVCIMVLVSIQMLINKQFISPKPLPGRAILLLVGVATGCISSLVAMGGGFITVAYLTWHNIDFKKAIGTSSAIAFPVAIAGTAGYWINGLGSDASSHALGFINLPAAVLISVASFILAPYGVRLAHHLPTGILKKILIVLTLCLSINMLFSILQ